jgi:hypothetical protein
VRGGGFESGTESWWRRYGGERSNWGFAGNHFCERTYCPPFVVKEPRVSLVRDLLAAYGFASDLSCARKTVDGRIGYRDCALVRRGNLIPSTFLYAVGILTPSELLYARP